MTDTSGTPQGAVPVFLRQDGDTLLALIEEISSEHADLAQRLREMVYNFAFEELIRLTR